MRALKLALFLLACYTVTSAQDSILPVSYIDSDPFGMGKFSERDWEDIDWVPMTKTAYKQHQDPEDASLIAYTIQGRFKIAWDEEYFYAVVDVVDDILTNNTDEHYWDDSVELYFDIGNDKETDYGVDDVQYVFGWNDSPDEVKAYNFDYPEEASIEDVEVYSDDTNDGYVIEFKIPWTTLKHDNPVPGDTIGFEIIVNDDDGIYSYNEYIDHRILWNANTTGAYQDPTLFGTIILTAAPGIAATPVISPGGGVYNDSIVVEITTETEGATVCYTTSGADPDASSTQYTMPITLYENTTIKAIAIKEGMENSEVSSADFTVNITSISNQLEGNELSIIPLPQSGLLKLTINNNLTGVFLITIYDLSGKPVLSGEVIKNSEFCTMYLNFSNLPEGIYIIKASQDFKSCSSKFYFR